MSHSIGRIAALGLGMALLGGTVEIEPVLANRLRRSTLFAVVAGRVALGLLNAPPIRGQQSQQIIAAPPPSFEVYRALRMVNPSPYMYFLRFPELDIVGSSPELLVRKEKDLAETRPIAGTRRRSSCAVIRRG